MTITDDEFSVLMIAAQGEYMLPIGRWKPSIESLTQKGLMCCQHINGGPQYTITRAGKAAINEREQTETESFSAASARVAKAQKAARELVEETAKLLVETAKVSSTLTGDTPETSARKWSPLILERALDILNGG
jgi:hypothetical protein